MTIEIVDFPIKNGGSFHSKLLVAAAEPSGPELKKSSTYHSLQRCKLEKVGLGEASKYVYIYIHILST